ncbi:hypothetical protein lpa_03031 [Legionella pneumophila 2300/99 Alcoy]|nr:hypothetical protein lpa_03031 [Legionella pneumophila 2300/99 Alcoy]
MPPAALYLTKISDKGSSYRKSARCRFQPIAPAWIINHLNHFEIKSRKTKVFAN